MSSGAPTTRRGGRRPGASGTREAVLEAARAAFAERGYEGATIRRIAGRAGVDPALVLHFHGSKHDLFAAAMAPPIEPGPALAAALAGDRSQVGRRLAEFAIGSWEDEERRQRLLGVVRATASDAVAADLLREMIGRQVIEPLAAALGGSDGRLRATLVAAQVVGLAMARYVMRLEPVASAPPADLVGWLAPTLQHYLLGAPGHETKEER